MTFLVGKKVKEKCKLKQQTDLVNIYRAKMMEIKMKKRNYKHILNTANNKKA